MIARETSKVDRGDDYIAAAGTLQDVQLIGISTAIVTNGQTIESRWNDVDDDR